MKTNDVQKQLGITKDALYFYEREGLIKPIRDNNGYRNYSSEDIRLLKMILFFRSLDISIEEIKQLLNGKAIIQEILKTKQEYLQDEINQKREKINMISKTLERKKAYFGYLTVPKNYQNEIYICFKENEIVIYDYYNTQKYTTLSYKDIDMIKLFICTRISSNSIRNNKIARVEGFSKGLHTYFYIDIDIKINHIIYQYESLSLDNMHEITDILLKQSHIDDQLGLLAIFQSYKDMNNIYKVLLSHLKKWEKEMEIDNPRGYEIKNQVELISTNIRKKDIQLKDILGMSKLILIKKEIISFIIIALVALLYLLFGN